MPTEIMRRSPGFCIYCMARGVQLTDEHAVPEGLGGTHVFKGASCKECAKITSRFEMTCLRGMFGPARVGLNLFGKRRERRRLSSLPVEITMFDGTRRTTQVPAADYPEILAMPYLPKARGLSATSSRWGLDYAPPPPERWSVAVPDDKANRLGRIFARSPGATSIAVPHDVALPDFYRLLAKIAHVTTLATSVNTFKPLLPALILGQESAPDGSFLVGGAFFPDGHRVTSIATGRGMHETIAQAIPFEGHGLLVSRIQLFSLLNAPVYEVCVGVTEELRPES